MLNYDAKGDGRTDDTKAFEEAWARACKVGGSTILVPSGFVFLVKPFSFSDSNCQLNIVFQVTHPQPIFRAREEYDLELPYRLSSTTYLVN